MWLSFFLFFSFFFNGGAGPVAGLQQESDCRGCYLYLGLCQLPRHPNKGPHFEGASPAALKNLWKLSSLVQRQSARVRFRICHPRPEIFAAHVLYASAFRRTGSRLPPSPLRNHSKKCIHSLYPVSTLYTLHSAIFTPDLADAPPQLPLPIPLSTPVFSNVSVSSV